MKIEISQKQLNHTTQKIDEIRQSKEETVLKKAITSFKKNVDELEKDLEALEKKRNEEKIVYYRRKREVEQKKRVQTLLMNKMEETKKQQQAWKQQLKEWDTDHSSCLLNGGNGISFLMELTGLSDGRSLDEMMNECETISLKKQPLKKQRNAVVKELEQSRQEINHLQHQITLLSKRIDENVIKQLEEEEEEKQQLLLIQTTILQDLKQCEVCGDNSIEEKYSKHNTLASNSSTGRRAV